MQWTFQHAYVWDTNALNWRVIVTLLFQEAGGSGSTAKKRRYYPPKLVDPHAPVTPRTPYFLFCDEHRPEILKEKGEIPIQALNRQLGEDWNKLDDKQKQVDSCGLEDISAEQYGFSLVIMNSQCPLLFIPQVYRDRYEVNKERYEAEMKKYKETDNYRAFQAKLKEIQNKKKATEKPMKEKRGRGRPRKHVSSSEESESEVRPVLQFQFPLARCF